LEITDGDDVSIVNFGGTGAFTTIEIVPLTPFCAVTVIRTGPSAFAVYTLPSKDRIDESLLDHVTGDPGIFVPY
jgi:hypothetical protein